jgi:hypothetical protein
VFFHEPQLEADHSLALAGLLVTTIPDSKRRVLSLDERVAIDALSQQLLRDHHAARADRRSVAGAADGWVRHGRDAGAAASGWQSLTNGCGQPHTRTSAKRLG